MWFFIANYGPGNWQKNCSPPKNKKKIYILTGSGQILNIYCDFQIGVWQTSKQFSDFLSIIKKKCEVLTVVKTTRNFKYRHPYDFIEWIINNAKLATDLELSDNLFCQVQSGPTSLKTQCLKKRKPALTQCLNAPKLHVYHTSDALFKNKVSLVYTFEW